MNLNIFFNISLPMIYIIYHSHSSWTNKNMTSKSNVYQINAGIPVIATTKTSDLPSNILLQPIESYFIVKKNKKKQNKTFTVLLSTYGVWLSTNVVRKTLLKKLGLTSNRLSLHPKRGGGEGREEGRTSKTLRNFPLLKLGLSLAGGCYGS